MNKLLKPNQEMLQQIKAMYDMFKGNPTAFIEEYSKKNEEFRKIMQSGKNPNEIFENMLSQRGLSKEIFAEIFR